MNGAERTVLYRDAREQLGMAALVQSAIDACAQLIVAAGPHQSAAHQADELCEAVAAVDIAMGRLHELLGDSVIDLHQSDKLAALRISVDDAIQRSKITGADRNGETSNEEEARQGNRSDGHQPPG